MNKRLAGSNQYLPNMNPSNTWYLLIIFDKRNSAMMIQRFGKPKLTNSFLGWNMSIKQLATIY